MRYLRHYATTLTILCFFSSPAFSAEKISGKTSVLQNFTGSWILTNKKSKQSISKISIKPFGRFVRIRVWGDCGNAHCDWGFATGHLFTGSSKSSAMPSTGTIMVKFRRINYIKILMIQPAKSGQINLTVYTRVNNSSKLSNHTKIYPFSREIAPIKVVKKHMPAHTRTAAPINIYQTSGGYSPRKNIASRKSPNLAPAKSKSILVNPSSSSRETCIHFNPSHTRIKRVGKRYKLLFGKQLLKDFSTYKQAQKSMRIIRRYKMNKQCFVGKPMEYYLSNEQSPFGKYKREDCIAFNPKKVDVHQVNGRWKLVDGAYWLMDFEQNRLSAYKARLIIRNYNFSKMCFIGRPKISMTYFRK